MGSSKHKHKSKKKKHNRSSESSDEKERHRHHKKHRKDKKEKRKDKPIIVEEYGSTDSDDDVILVSSPPPAPVLSRGAKRKKSESPPPPPKLYRRDSPQYTRQIDLSRSDTPPRTRIDLSRSDSPPYIRGTIDLSRKESPRRIDLSRKASPPHSRARIDLSRKESPPHSRGRIDMSRRDSTPPIPEPPNISKRAQSPEKRSSEASLSIEETNRLRAKLGLKPLAMSGTSDDDRPKKDVHGGVDMGDFVHKPADNISSKTTAQKLKEKLDLKKEKRQLEKKLLRVKKLADSDSDDDAKKWVEKNRKIISEKELARKKAEELDAMDEVFGIGDLINEDLKETKKNAYTARDLKGLTVEHEIDHFMEGKDVILTLKDKDVLDNADDTLVNVNMLDEERYKKNLDRRRQKPGYNAYDDDEFETMNSMLESKVLSKYDEEIDGEQKKSFALGMNAEQLEAQKRESIRDRLLQRNAGKRLETLSSTNLKIASDYLTEEEIATKFKKTKRKVRKIRKPRPLKADDLLPNNGPIKDVPESYVTLTSNGDERIKGEPKGEPADDDMMDIDDLPSPLSNDEQQNIKIEDEEDDSELQIALEKSRRLKQAENKEDSIGKVASMVKREEASDAGGASGSITLNATAEFCRTLGDIPTYGLAGNREDAAQNLLDFEHEMKLDRKEIEESVTGWNEVELDSTPVDIKAYEMPILDAEPDISSGVAGALKMAIYKGYIQGETEKRSHAPRFAHLQAQHYSIDDKAHNMEDDKHARRERYCGPTTDFKEKEGYKPSIKLDYIDDDGHVLCAKEAFRYLSHKFHGKGPGKNKIEKRLKKSEQEALMKQMSSTDTPLGTLNMLQQKQKETQSPFVVLSGSKQGQSTSIAKMKF